MYLQVPLTVRKMVPAGFPVGLFLSLPLMVRKIPCMDNLKNRKNMSGLHSNWQGGGVALAHPRTAKYFYQHR